MTEQSPGVLRRRHCGLSAANVADNTNSGAVTASGNEAGGIVGEQTNWGPYPATPTRQT